MEEQGRVIIENLSQHQKARLRTKIDQDIITIPGRSSALNRIFAL
jgi:hypothetical protein